MSKVFIKSFKFTKHPLNLKKKKQTNKQTNKKNKNKNKKQKQKQKKKTNKWGYTNYRL